MDLKWQDFECRLMLGTWSCSWVYGFNKSKVVCRLYFKVPFNI